MCLHLRYPYWAEQGIRILVNGDPVEVAGGPGRFVAVDGTWRDGDVVRVEWPFSLRLEPMPDDPNRVAVMYGPLVLAGDLGPVENPQSSDPGFVPVFMTSERDPAQWLTAVADQPNTFRTRQVGRPRQVELKPFYLVHDRRYSVYWDLLTEEGWASRELARKNELKTLEMLDERTIDRIHPGVEQSEKSHEFKGENSHAGRFRQRENRGAREGWLSYRLKVDPDRPVALLLEFWGGFPGKKKFDILVDGEKRIAGEDTSNKKDGYFIREEYPVPEALTRGKETVLVKFQSLPDNRIGPSLISGCWEASQGIQTRSTSKSFIPDIHALQATIDIGVVD